MKRFPILWSWASYAGWPLSIPFHIIEPHRAQAMTNHQQTIERLAERGGLDPIEAWCVCHDVTWQQRCSLNEARYWLEAVCDAKDPTNG